MLKEFVTSLFLQLFKIIVANHWSDWDRTYIRLVLVHFHVLFKEIKYSYTKSLLQTIWSYCSKTFWNRCCKSFEVIVTNLWSHCCNPFEVIVTNRLKSLLQTVWSHCSKTIWNHCYKPLKSLLHTVWSHCYKQAQM